MAIVDYAYPCMMAEKALRNLHDAMLDNNYDKALEHALVAVAETRLAYQSIKEMKEKASARETPGQLAVPNVQGQTAAKGKSKAATKAHLS